MLKIWFRIVFLLMLILTSSNSTYAQIADSIRILIDKSHEVELTKEQYNNVLLELSRVEQFTNGLIYAEKFMELCERTKDTAYLVKAINRKAEQLTDLSRVEEGIAFCEKEFHTFREQDSIELQLLCFKWGVLYKLNGEYKKGIEVYRKITSPKLKRKIIYLNNISLLYAESGDHDTARYYLNFILENEMFDYSYDKGIVLNNLAYYTSQVGKYEEALGYLDSATCYLDRENRLYHVRSLFSNYFDVYQGLGRIEDAIPMLDSIKKYNQLIYDQKLEEEIYEIKNAVKRESDLKQRVKVVDNKIQWYERQILLWVIIIIILILGGVFLFFYRNLKARNSKMLLEQQLLRSQMTPHFIFNSLSVIQGMILDSKQEKAVTYLTKFSRLIREILETSSSKLIPLEKELETVKNYLGLQQLQMDLELSYSINLDESIEVDELLIPPMILQVFVENCVEHGFKGISEEPEITISIQREGQSIHIEIMDNGIGLTDRPRNPQKKVRSTSITKERLALLSKEYKIKSSVEIMNRKPLGEQGVTVKLILPQINDL